MYFTYLAIFDPDEQGTRYSVTFLVLPGCITKDDSLQQTLTTNVEEAISLYMEPDYDEDKRTLPKATDIANN